MFRLFRTLLFTNSHVLTKKNFNLCGIATAISTCNCCTCRPSLFEIKFLNMLLFSVYPIKPQTSWSGIFANCANPYLKRVPAGWVLQLNRRVWLCGGFY